ncbi:MAG TPA: hypothetical protein VMJ92_00230 [Candidatus Limnocylindrales bacterium]|nr:hypothetical protein [Candidatus Limnocylindrales bacterium]
MLLLALIALTTLAANGARRLRYMATAFVAVSLSANVVGALETTLPLLTVTVCAGVVAGGILFVAAGDARYGEEPGWRLWLATIVAAAATPVAYATFRLGTAAPALDLVLPDPDGVALQVAAFWLLASGMAILITARTAVRGTLGALLMITGVQLLVRLLPIPQLTYTLLLAWLEVVIALAGAFLVVNERAVLEA